MATQHEITLMRHYSVSLELRDNMLNTKGTLFSRNPLDADQLISVASQYRIEYSLESDMLLLSHPFKDGKSLFSMRVHSVGPRKPTSLTEFRRVARFIGATTL